MTKFLRIRCQLSNFIFTSYSNTSFSFENSAMWLKGILTLIVIQKLKIPLHSFIKSITHLNTPFNSRFGDNNGTEREGHPWKIKREIES